jgi:hypothetical protein
MAATPDLTQNNQVQKTTELPWMLQLVLQWYAARNFNVTSWTLGAVKNDAGDWILSFRTPALPTQK